MIEEKRNYLKEFYDKKDNINYEEILRKTNNANENEIKMIQLDIKRLQNRLEEKQTELHIELDKAYNGSFVQTKKNIVLSYNTKNDTIYFDLHSGCRVSCNEETDTKYYLNTKNGFVNVAVGYSYENASIIIKRYKYSINTENTSIKLTPLQIYIVNFLDNTQKQLNLLNNFISDVSDYRITETLNCIKDNEFINEFYGIDYKGKYDLKALQRKQLMNRSFEIIIKQAPNEIVDKLLNNEYKECLPIHKLLNVQKDTYDNAIERNLIKELVDNIDYVSGAHKDKINKSEKEWLDLIEELKAREEDLKFYDISYTRYYYNEDTLLTLLANCYCTNEYIRQFYSFNKYMNYVIEETINQGYTSLYNFISELNDYIRMCIGLGIKPTLYSSYLKQTHDITSRNYKIKVEQEKEEIFKTRYENFKEYNTTNDYIVIAPKETKDLQEEGSNLNHCVASYIKRVIDGECLIYFLRKQDKQEESLITLEVRNNAIVQVKGSHNRKPSEEERNALEEFAKYKEMEVRF